MQGFQNHVQSQTQFPKDPFILSSINTYLYVQGREDTQTELNPEMTTTDNEKFKIGI